MKIQDWRLRLVSRWDSTWRGRQRRVPPGHETKSSILYLHSLTVRPMEIVRLSGYPLIQDSLKDLYRSKRITTYIVPFVIGMLLAWDSIVGISIPSSISLLASLFTRFIIHHLATNSLVVMLARLMWCALPRGPRDTSPTIGVTNPNLEIRQPNMYLWRHL